MHSDTQLMVREAVGVFASEDALQAAIDDLLSHGFDRAELTLLASSDSVEEKLGHAFRRVAEVEDDVEAPRIAYVAEEDVGAAEGAVLGGLIYIGALAGLVPVVASGGALATALAALVLGGGAGAAVGTVLARLIGAEHGGYITDQLEHGGLALWVRTWNAGDERRATEILKAHSGRHVHVHGVPDHAYVPDNSVLTVRQAPDDEDGVVDDGNGIYYASGKMFSDPGSAWAYLDRQKYLDSLYHVLKGQDFDLDDALLDPARNFRSVEEVLAQAYPDFVKLELLRRWAYDVKTLEVADDEGMTGPTSADLLQHIRQAILKLQAGS